MSKFQIGQTYSARSACDYDCVFSFTVTKRTGKFLTIEDRHGKTRRVGVRDRYGVEACSPLGSYSMAPVLFADRASA